MLPTDRTLIRYQVLVEEARSAVERERLARLARAAGPARPAPGCSVLDGLVARLLARLAHQSAPGAESAAERSCGSGSARAPRPGAYSVSARRTRA